MRHFFYLLLIAGLFPIVVVAQPFLNDSSSAFAPSEAHYLWPTNASSHLSSTFAETRSRHFHAALDIKTWGRRGYDIYATRDGTLYRMAIGPRGYGKVLYLKHDDGSFSVYAHLMSFNDKLQQYADSLRFAEDYIPSFDRIIKDENIRIEQGDLIAYSGATGIGPPHLHFELRTPSNKPFNPLLTNLSVQDHIPPRITGLSVEPLSPYSIVEGNKKVYTRSPKAQNGRFDFGTIEVTGPVGLGLNVYDQADKVTNAYAVYELSMSVNGQQRFYSRVDSFSYDETNQMFIDRVYPLLRQYGQGYQRLFIADGNTLPFYKTDGKQGKLNLPPGRHTITIKATDFFGNESEATVNLIVYEQKERIPVTPYSRFSLKQNFTPSIERWQWFNNWVNIPKKSFGSITTGIWDYNKVSSYQNFITIDLESLDNLFMNIPGIGPTIFHRMIPAQSGLITALSHEAMAIFPEDSFHDTVSVTMTAQQFRTDSVKVTIGPEVYPLKKSYQFRIKRDSMLTDTSKLAFYKYNDRYDTKYRITTRFTGDHIIGETSSLGTFVTMRDNTPPTLRGPGLTQRPDGQWLIYIGARDNLSGIDHKRTNITVNGQRGLAEYEPEERRILYYHPDFTPSASMDIQIEVYDQMGNKTEKYFQLSR
ncbi:hypothetical protein LQ318_00425 [Aliifodinibius salicampi]|uniref:Peptidase family M23 n=1 Tax=Fodinibius salicampi TaxID=1920655 RepID=A0ABT3PU46_9BACT|nr:M23 family metallopeptidase [Fodinibius salicampi]MCW9711355.1 hypothetical protein [Fodinibius salicampi]